MRDELGRADATVDAADRAFTEAQTRANAAKAALFDAWAEAVQAGRSPAELEERTRKGKTAEQIEAGLTFTAAYIRRVVRERGVGPIPRGRKPRKP